MYQKMRPVLRWVVVVLATGIGINLYGHELRPGYLEITSVSESEYQVLWKQPTREQRVLGLAPYFPDDCNTSSRTATISINSFLIEKFTLVCSESLEGRQIGILGLSRTLTDVYLRVSIGSAEFTSLLRPENNSTTIDTRTGLPTFDYLWVGAQHLLFGFDHLLFLLCLIYVVPNFIQLLKVITAFTVAHSITLLLGVLGYIAISQSAVELVIALSILYFAYIACYQDTNDYAWHKSWWIIFGFGLVHGAGFASALSDIGLPQEALVPALLLFNLGIELAQVLLVGVVLVVLAVGRRWLVDLPLSLKNAPLGASAAVAVFLICDRSWSTFF